MYSKNNDTAGWCLAFALFLPVGATAEDLTGSVVAVADGDTLTLLDPQRRQHKVRLAGVDAPEKAQDFGNRSRQSLSELAFGKVVTIEGSKTDRYGRLLGKVRVGRTDVNLEQIRRGMAWHYKAYAREQHVVDRVSYAYAELQAQRQREGLWAAPQPTPPWDFRRARRR
ncbi:MAG TPA: thermonuclease family protein [Ramlibacter sp.]